MFWARLGEAPLSGTEGHRALTAHQMIESGEWLAPRLYGRPYLRKPPLHYWLIAAAETIAGRAGEWVWRAPSAIAATGMVLLAAVFSARWIGPSAALPGGLACAAMVPLWSQSRSADIDAVNTLATALAAWLTLDLSFRPARAWLRAWLLALAAGAALLAKGPAGLPAVGAAAAAAAAHARRKGYPREFGRNATLGFGAAAALFAMWALAAAARFHARGEAPDLSGAIEVLNMVRGHGLPKWLEVLAMPVRVFVYALPFSLAPWLAHRKATEEDDPAFVAARWSGRVFLWGSLATAAAGATNPRYGYPCLPLLAPAAAAVWTRRRELAPRARRVVDVGGALVAVALVAGAIAFVPYDVARRTRRSSIPAAAELQRQVPPDALCGSDMVLWTHPETFHYARRRAVWEPAAKTAQRTGEIWYVFSESEWTAAPEELRRHFELCGALPTRAIPSRLARFRPPPPAGSGAPPVNGAEAVDQRFPAGPARVPAFPR